MIADPAEKSDSAIIRCPPRVEVGGMPELRAAASAIVLLIGSLIVLVVMVLAVLLILACELMGRLRRCSFRAANRKALERR